MSSSNQTPVVHIICIGLALGLLLSGASSFRLHDQNVSSEVLIVGEDDGDDVLVESCSSGDWAVHIPDLNFQIPGLLLKTGGNTNRKPASLALVEDSKALQTSLLQITQQVASAFKLSNTSAAQLQLLVANVENQFQEVNRALNSSELIIELIAPRLTNITESTKTIAQLFYLMASQFEELFNLTRAVKNSAVKIRAKLERANVGVIKRKASRINSRRKLTMAIQSLRRTIADLIRRLQRDRVELKTTTQEWQALKSRINFTQDGEWANVKARFERAKWRWNCSRQVLNKTQEKLHKWSQLDEELAVAIEESRQESTEIHEEMILLLNGTSRNSSSSSIVQLERSRNLTTDFAHYYSDAGGFFLGIGSRISNILAGIVLPQHLSTGEAFATLRSHLKKVKCDLDRNGRFIVLTDAGKSPKKDANDKRTNIVGFLLGGPAASATTKENCDDDFSSLRS